MKKLPLTEGQRNEIINSRLTNVELSKIYDRSHKTISGIRIAADKGVGHKQGNYKLTPEQNEIIRNPLLSVKEAHEKSGVSKRHIYTIRERYNVVYVKPVVEKKKRVYKPRPKVVKAIKKKPLPSVIKEAKKPKEHKEKVRLNASMTHAEQEYIIRKIAKEIAKNNPLTEAEKIASGKFKWITRINKYNKTERALIKI